ncbi:MAG: RDD family protein [Halobacteriovoraceae bacterium]|nr:RDD family protein [Halobacteriovoraceae bacterium]
MDNHDLDFEMPKFKPITQGLGFNKVKKNEVGANEFKTKSQYRKATVLQQNELSNKLKGQVVINPNVPPQVPSHLAKKREDNFTPATLQIESVKITSKFFSWIIDFALVVFMAMASTYIIASFAFDKVTPEFVFKNSFLLFNITLPLGLFYYVFYFSMFWKTTHKTMGMVLLGLEIQSTESSKEVRFNQTLVRAVLSLFSLLTCGVLEISGLIDAITWTKVRSKK